jgi:asparagine synthetase B (glutamine-hydrolysing)
MCGIMAVPSPDRSLWVDPAQHLGFGHRRLSIIALGDGQQPMFSEDKSLVVVFNDEIDNYRELRDELAARGRRFRTGSDTEAILHGYAEWGDDCVKHLIADVPLGVFLNGGVDSSAVVAMMKELKVPDIETFTVDYEAGQTEGEGRFADIVVKHIGTRHHLVRLEPQDFLASLRAQIGFCEEPLVGAPAIALHHLSIAARRSVKAVLSGEGSDEVFAGYGSYHTMQRIERLLAREALPCIRRGAIEEVLSRHERGVEDHSRTILTLLVLREWLDQHAKA